jgi:16S rRNA processing protein RimM
VDYVRFVEHTHINDSERYKGCDLFVAETDRAPLEEGEYYYNDLIGMTVHSRSFTGTVKTVREMPQGAMLVVETTGKDVLIPFHKAFIERVDEAKGVIHVTDWEGLL